MKALNRIAIHDQATGMDALVALSLLSLIAGENEGVRWVDLIPLELEGLVSISRGTAHILCNATPRGFAVGEELVTQFMEENT